MWRIRRDMAPTEYTARLVSSCFCVALVLSSVLLPQTEGRLARVRREECEDGTYLHEGRNCCKCATGQKVKVHCTSQAQTQCDLCEPGKEYQSHANYLENCEPCTSCSQPSANLEVERECTAYHDSVCKCKKDHYCPGGKPHCKICEPCQTCGPEGIKSHCSATNNTVCNEVQTNDKTAMTAGILTSVVIAVALGIAGFLFWWKRRSASKTIQNTNVTPEEETPLEVVSDAVPPVSLRPYIPDIAGVLGWQDMRNLAMHSNIPNGRIDNCEVDFPNDSLERTIALLRVWEEKESKDASYKLIQYLKRNNKNNKVDEITKLFQNSSNSECA